MTTPNWQRIASERLKEIRRLRRVIAHRASLAGDVAAASLSRRIHAGCLASLSDERTQRLIADVKADVVRDMDVTP